jgi:hypothetical protein
MGWRGSQMEDQLSLERSPCPTIDLFLKVGDHVLPTSVVITIDQKPPAAGV